MARPGIRVNPGGERHHYLCHANLIVIESAKKSGVEIGCREFFKVGIVVTLLTMALSMAFLYLQIAMGLLS